MTNDLTEAQKDAATVAWASPAALGHIASEGKWLPFEHLLKIDEYLLAVAAGDIDRLIVEAPVRHGKSELISHYLPAWWLGRKPDDQLILASYEATFAAGWGRKARDTLSEVGPRVFGVDVAEMPAARDWWYVAGKHEGVMRTAGVGGGITGRGANLLLIDDPLKNDADANSPVMREHIWNWWQATASSRLQPKGRAIVVMARWHEDDLAGRLQEKNPDRWTVLRLPALAEENDALGRAPGEALCPEMYDEKMLEEKRKEMGAYWFGALYQQAPAPVEGMMFKRKDFSYWEMEMDSEGKPLLYKLKHEDDVKYIHTSSCVEFQTVDVAASDKTAADWTVVSTWAVTPNKDLLLLKCDRQKFETLQVAEFLKGVNDEAGSAPMWIETFGAGRVPFKQLIRSNYPVRELKVEHGTRNDKTQRAMLAIAAYEAHHIYHPRGKESIGTEVTLDDFETELTSYPTGTHDDMVDTVSYAAQLLPELSAISAVRQPEHKPLTGDVMRMQF